MHTNGLVLAITGATDGIGKAYARQLACLGFNIVLISRTHSKLKEVSKAIGNVRNKKKNQNVILISCSLFNRN